VPRSKPEGKPNSSLADALAGVLAGLVNGDDCCVDAWALRSRSELVLLPKPGHSRQTPSLRPIGMYEALRKLARRFLSRRLISETRGFFGLTQVGVGYSGGCELVTRILQLESLPAEPFGRLSMDFANTSNSVSRAHAREVVRQLFCAGFHFLRRVYDEASTGPQLATLGAENHTFVAWTGVQQGDSGVVSCAQISLKLHYAPSCVNTMSSCQSCTTYAKVAYRRQC